MIIWIPEILNSENPYFLHQIYYTERRRLTMKDMRVLKVNPFVCEIAAVNGPAAAILYSYAAMLAFLLYRQS